MFDIRRFSVHDGPGLRTTVFFKGCPLKCAWCHNPESQARAPELIFWDDRCQRCQVCILTCKQGAITLVDDHILTDPAKCISCGDLHGNLLRRSTPDRGGGKCRVASVMSEVQRDVSFYDQSGGGVTFSGGEPLMQPDYLVALLSACKASDIHTTLDTCGQASWSTLDRIRSYVDLFLYDLKLMDPGRHKQQTGVTNARILENLKGFPGMGMRLYCVCRSFPAPTRTLKTSGLLGPLRRHCLP